MKKDYITSEEMAENRKKPTQQEIDKVERSIDMVSQQIKREDLAYKNAFNKFWELFRACTTHTKEENRKGKTLKIYYQCMSAFDKAILEHIGDEKNLNKLKEYQALVVEWSKRNELMKHG